MCTIQVCCTTKYTTKFDHVVKHDITVQIQIQNENAQLKLPNYAKSNVYDLCSLYVRYPTY